MFSEAIADRECKRVPSSAALWGYQPAFPTSHFASFTSLAGVLRQHLVNLPRDGARKPRKFSIEIVLRQIGTSPICLKTPGEIRRLNRPQSRVFSSGFWFSGEKNRGGF